MAQLEKPVRTSGTFAKTQLLVFLTDSSGNSYRTGALLKFFDIESGKLIKKCYLMVDSNGNPIPLNLSAGTYELKIGEGAAQVSRKIVLEAGKQNKVFISGGKGALRFRYEGEHDSILIPAKELEARVILRSRPEQVTIQDCSDEYPYAPGNYYVEVNTLPISRFNTDIDVFGITEIQLPYPVMLQIVNGKPLGLVNLYSIYISQKGETIQKISEIKVTGNNADQLLRIKPGTYEARWNNYSSEQIGEEKKMRFRVPPSKSMSIELK